MRSGLACSLYVSFGQPALVPTIVVIDIKPGSEKNNVNLCAQGGIKVAIFSAAHFGATSVDPLTVDLAGASVKLFGKDQEPRTEESDVNSDGITDFVLHVEAADIGVAGDTAKTPFGSAQWLYATPDTGSRSVDSYGRGFWPQPRFTTCPPVQGIGHAEPL